MAYASQGLFTVPGSGFINVNAAYQEQDRQAAIRRELTGQAGPKRLTLSEKAAIIDRNVILPNLERLKAFGTSTSDAKLQFSGRAYILPPVTKQRMNHFGPFDVDGHFGGLGLRQHMVDELNESLGNVEKYNMKAVDNFTLESKKAKKFWSKKQAPVKTPQYANDKFVTDIFNKKFAAARIPVYILHEEVNGPGSAVPMVMHPSSQSGNYFAEMHAWADKHWKNVPEQPYQSEVITHFGF